MQTIEEDASGTVLIVDDDFTVRLLAREALEQAGFTVQENDDGVGVLAQFEEQEPDIVLLDVMLPGFPGCGSRSTSRGRTSCRKACRRPPAASLPPPASGPSAWSWN